MLPQIVNLVDEVHDSLAFVFSEAPNRPTLDFIERFFCDVTFSHGLSRSEELHSPI